MGLGPSKPVTPVINENQKQNVTNAVSSSKLIPVTPAVGPNGLPIKNEKPVVTNPLLGQQGGRKRKSKRVKRKRKSVRR